MCGRKNRNTTSPIEPLTQIIEEVLEWICRVCGRRSRPFIGKKTGQNRTKELQCKGAVRVLSKILYIISLLRYSYIYL